MRIRGEDHDTYPTLCPGTLSRLGDVGQQLGGVHIRAGFGGEKIWAAVAAFGTADARRTVLYEIAPIAATNG